MKLKRTEAEAAAQAALTARFTICAGSGETVAVLFHSAKPGARYRSQCPRCAYANVQNERVSYTTIVPHHFPKEAK